MFFFRGPINKMLKTVSGVTVSSVTMTGTFCRSQSCTCSSSSTSSTVWPVEMYSLLLLPHFTSCFHVCVFPPAERAMFCCKYRKCVTPPLCCLWWIVFTLTGMMDASCAAAPWPFLYGFDPALRLWGTSLSSSCSLFCSFVWLKFYSSLHLCLTVFIFSVRRYGFSKQSKQDKVRITPVQNKQMGHFAIRTSLCWIICPARVLNNKTGELETPSDISLTTGKKSEAPTCFSVRLHRGVRKFCYKS